MAGCGLEEASLVAGCCEYQVQRNAENLLTSREQLRCQEKRHAKKLFILRQD